MADNPFPPDSLKHLIVGALDRSPGLLSPVEVADQIERDHDTVKNTMGEMARAGDIARPWRGAYTVKGREVKRKEKVAEIAKLGEPKPGDPGLPVRRREARSGSDTFTLVIYPGVTASCGPGRLVDIVQEDDALRYQLTRVFFRALLGFDPPTELRGIQVEGTSMEPDIRHGQYVLYVPPGEIETGKRYLYQIEDLQTNDWTLYLKRLQRYHGGGVKVISDNHGLGIEDEVLLPEKGGVLRHKETGCLVKMHLVGRVLWPREGDDSNETRILSQMIERLASMGLVRT